MDNLTQNIAEDVSDFTQELAENMNNTDLPNKENKKAGTSIVLLAFNYAGVIFAYLNIIFYVVKVPKVYGGIVALVALMISAVLLTTKDKNGAAKYNAATRLQAGILIFAALVVAVFWKYS